LSLEHLAQIRQSIVPAKHTSSFDKQQHVDSVIYWKQAYEKAAAQETKLQDRIYELEQERQSNEPLTASPPQPVNQNKKRTRDTLRTAKANMQSKRRKLGTSDRESTDDDANVHLMVDTSRGGVLI